MALKTDARTCRPPSANEARRRRKALAPSLSASSAATPVWNDTAGGEAASGQLHGRVTSVAGFALRGFIVYPADIPQFLDVDVMEPVIAHWRRRTSVRRRARAPQGKIRYRSRTPCFRQTRGQSALPMCGYRGDPARVQRHPSTGAGMRYPRPRSLRMYFGFLASSPSLPRSLRMALRMVSGLAPPRSPHTRRRSVS